MGKNISLKSIVDFENDNINFYIPSYQRGYRWKSRQVSQLIDDIDSFSPTESTPFYFLQALAVAKDIENNRVNVVDGQQRLTTLKRKRVRDATLLSIFQFFTFAARI